MRINFFLGDDIEKQLRDYIKENNNTISKTIETAIVLFLKSKSYTKNLETELERHKEYLRQTDPNYEKDF